jgi:hypothetical protein
MSKVLEKATSHFRGKLSAELMKVEVPEWEAQIYFKPTITLKEQGKLIELASSGKQVEALVETLIVKARNEDGSKMFTQMDRQVLLNEVDPGVLIRVVSEINNNIDNNDMDAVEKNS